MIKIFCCYHISSRWDDGPQPKFKYNKK